MHGRNQPSRPPRADGEKLASYLGWFSLGLGIAQLTAPSRVNRLIGAPDGRGSRAIVRACGVREIASGIGIFATSRPVLPVWSRVAGDMVDLTLLRFAQASRRSDPARVRA